jgi:hypothetical protein
MRWRVRSSHPAPISPQLRGPFRLTCSSGMASCPPSVHEQFAWPYEGRDPQTSNAGWRVARPHRPRLRRGRQAAATPGRHFATKREAQAALNEALAGLQQGSDVVPSKQTVRDVLETWIVTVKPELALTAWTNYGRVVERYVLLDRGRVDGRPLAVKSVKLAHRVLHRALADGVRWNVVPSNPASSVRAPKGEHKEMSVWSSEEA